MNSSKRIGRILAVALLGVPLTAMTPRPFRGSPEPPPPPVCEPPDCLWMATFDGLASAGDYPRALALSPAGDRVFVSGLTTVVGGGFIGVTLGYSTADGTVAWRATDPTGGGDIAAGSSRVYVGGSSTGAFDAATGARAWEASDLAGAKLALDSSETKVFALTSQTSTTYPELVALDAVTGTVLWVRHLRSRDRVFGTDLVVAPSGHVIYVTGSRQNATSTSSGFTMLAYDTQDGHRRWASTDRSESGAGWGVTISGDGRTLFAAGYRGRYFTTIAYAARSGTALWTNDLRRPTWFAPIALHVLQNDDQVFATGVTDIDGLFGFVTVSYDEVTGHRLWTRATDSCRAPTALAVSPDGRDVLVEGECGGMTTIDYRAGDGVRQWSRTLEGGRDSDGTDLVVGSDGTPFALGRLNRGSVGQADFVTIAYAP